MKLQSKTLVALAVSGLVAGYTMVPLAFAGDDTTTGHTEKSGCKGKDACKSTKDAAQDAKDVAHDAKDAAHDAKDAAHDAAHEAGDKDSCKGKDGCKAK